MTRDNFEKLARSAIRELPRGFSEKLENVVIVVQDAPTPEQLKKQGIKKPNLLLGLYEGVPQDRRGTGYSGVLPDRITIFQKPIETICRGDDEIVGQIQQTVRHEIAHHFGFEEKDIPE